jgi:hypothetical protein
MGLFGHVSGLTRLAQQYPAAERPEGVERLKQTVKIGAVRYRGCVTVTVSSQGLYLRMQAPLSRYPAVLIPWDEVKGTRGARLYGRRGTRLSIGRPEVGAVTMYEELFRLTQPHLSEGQRGSPQERVAG